MNLTQLRVLVAIADTGSITQAAERLGVTQSGASQAISTLEGHLGVRLSVRERRGMSLTAVGEDVAALARQSLASLESIRQVADAARDIERGRIRLASFPSVFATLLPSLLKRFKARHPGIQVMALEATDEEVAAWLASGTIDIGVVMGPASEWVGVPMYRDEWVAVVPAGHRLSRQAEGGVSFEELAAEPFVLATGGCATHARSIARQKGVELSDVRLEVRDWASAFALVAEGLGVSLVPALNLPEKRHGLRALKLSEPIYRELGWAVSRHGVDSPLVRAFLQLASTDAVHQASYRVANHRD